MSRNIWLIVTKYGTQEHQGKMKTKFDLIFKVTEVIQGDDMKDGFHSISQEIFDISSPDVVHRSTGASHNQV